MKKTTSYRLLMLLYLAAVCFLCFTDFKNSMGIPSRLLGIPTDRIVHFCMFFPFAFIATGCLSGRPFKPGKAVLMTCVIFLCGCIVAGGTEIIQGFLPYRDMDRYDFFADAVALAVSSLIVFIKDV